PSSGAVVPRFIFFFEPAQRPRTSADNGCMTKTHDPSSSDLALETLIAETASEAFASVRAEIEAVPQSAIAPNNLEIPRAARRGLAVAARLEPLVPALARLPELDF